MSAKIITVAQQKGGAGKTTLAIHLAVAFSKHGYNTLLLDTDPQGTASQWHGRRRERDLGLMATSGWRLTKDLSMAKDNYDIIVIDSPPHTESDAKEAMRAADMVLMPLQPSPADLWAVQETHKMVMREGKEHMAVLTRVVPNAKNTDEIRKKLMILDIPCTRFSIGNRVVFANAMEEGKTVLDYPKSTSSSEVEGILKEVSKRMEMELKKDGIFKNILKFKKAG